MQQSKAEEKIILQEYDYTEEESELLDLLAFDFYIATYHRTAEVNGIYLNLYQLKDGVWEDIGSMGAGVFDDTEALDGKLAVQLQEDDAVWLSVQSDDGSNVLSKLEELKIDIADKKRSEVSLHESQEIALNEETVIRIIAVDEKQRIEMELNDFYETKKFEDLDLVLAVTVTFSDQWGED